MFFKLVLFLAALFTIEIVLLVQIGELIGLGWTLAGLLTAGFIGAWLVRTEGFRALMQIRNDLQAHRAPADSMLDVLLILVAAGFLIMPGVISDVIGFTLLLPPVRAALKPMLRKRFQRARADGWRILSRPGSAGPGGLPGDDVIDVESEVKLPKRDSRE